MTGQDDHWSTTEGVCVRTRGLLCFYSPCNCRDRSMRPQLGSTRSTSWGSRIVYSYTRAGAFPFCSLAFRFWQLWAKSKTVRILPRRILPHLLWRRPHFDLAPVWPLFDADRYTLRGCGSGYIDRQENSTPPVGNIRSKASNTLTWNSYTLSTLNWWHRRCYRPAYHCY